MSLSTERDKLGRELEKIKEKKEAELLSVKKQSSKSDKEKLKVEQDLMESRARAGRLEERVSNLNKIIEQLELKNKDVLSDLEQVEENRNRA